MISYRVRVLDIHPLRPQRFVEGVLRRQLRHLHLWQCLHLHQRVDGIAPVHHWPLSLLPLHRCEECLTPQVVIRSSEVTIGEECHPPRTVLRLYEVTMTSALYLHRLSEHVTVGEDRVLGIAHIRAVDIPASGDGELMCQFGTSLRDKQIVIAVFLIDMRSLRISASRASPERFAWSELFSCLHVYLTEHDGIVGVRHHITLAILEPQRGVDTLLFQPHRLTPRTSRVFCRNHEVTAIANVGGYHIIGTLVVSDSRGVDAQPRICALQRQLTLPVEHISDQFPVHQVLRVIDGHSREIMKR